MTSKGFVWEESLYVTAAFVEAFIVSDHILDLIRDLDEIPAVHFFDEISCVRKSLNFVFFDVIARITQLYLVRPNRKEGVMRQLGIFNTSPMIIEAI